MLAVIVAQVYCVGDGGLILLKVIGLVDRYTDIAFCGNFSNSILFVVESFF